MTPFSDIALAAYCPRKLYYARRTDRDPPPVVAERRAMAFEYPALLDDPERLAAAPIACSSADWRAAIRRARDLACWPAVTDPVDRDVLLEGRRCRGVVHKVLDLEPGPVPGMISAGQPPGHGVWTPDSVRAVAAASALAGEHERRVDHAVVEYPAVGVVRPIRIGVRRRAAFRRALRAAESIDGPPPRLRSESKCRPCEYRGQCGVRTRSARSWL